MQERVAVLGAVVRVVARASVAMPTYSIPSGPNLMQPPLWLLKSWLMEAMVRTTVLFATFGFDVTDSRRGCHRVVGVVDEEAAVVLVVGVEREVEEAA